MMPKDHRVAAMRDLLQWLTAHHFGIVAQTLTGVVASHWKGHTVLIEWTGEVLDLTIHEVRDRKEASVHEHRAMGLKAEGFYAVCIKLRAADPYAAVAVRTTLQEWAKEAAAWLK